MAQYLSLIHIYHRTGGLFVLGSHVARYTTCINPNRFYAAFKYTVFDQTLIIAADPTEEVPFNAKNLSGNMAISNRATIAGSQRARVGLRVNHGLIQSQILQR